MKTKWSELDIVNLVRMYAEYEGERVPVKDIAELLGRSEAAVRCKAFELGLTDPNRPRAHNPSNGRTKTIYPKVCPACNKEFEVPASQKTQVTCSKSCAAKQRGGYGHRYSRARSGKRVDLNNIFFRSSWEANYARYLNWLKDRGEIHAWWFEPRHFHFPVKRGNVSYTPDFKVQLSEDEKDYQWHEVKGWMDQNSRTKLSRFERYFPEEFERLIVIDRPAYSAVAAQMSNLLPNWETA